MRLRDVAAEMDLHVGCSDHNCVWGGPVGMGTNGGCQCLKKDGAELRGQLLAMRSVAMLLLAQRKP